MKGGANMDKLKWRAAIVNAWRHGHYRKALLIMAQNRGDKGDVISLIDTFVENADPTDDWEDKT